MFSGIVIFAYLLRVPFIAVVQPDKIMNYDTIAETIKDNLPEQYQEEADSIDAIRQHYNGFDASDPEKSLKHMDGIAKEVKELDKQTGTSEAVKNAEEVEKYEKAWGELLKTITKWWDALIKIFTDAWEELLKIYEENFAK